MVVHKEGSMPKNVGLLDKIIRLAVAAALAIFGLFQLSTGLWWVGLLAVVPLVTGLTGYCPIWHLTGIRTVSVKTL